jgi:hypothetical protein
MPSSDREALLRYLNNDSEVKNYKQMAGTYLDTCLAAVARAVWQRTPQMGSPYRQTRVYISNVPHKFEDLVLTPLTLAVPRGFMSVQSEADAPFLLLCGDTAAQEACDVVLDNNVFKNAVVLPDDCIARHRLLKALFLLVTAES